jgi:hypothetical protein
MGSRDDEMRFLMGVKFPIEMNTKDDEIGYGFYHITKKENRAEIAKKGLTPKSATDKGKGENRCFFAFGAQGVLGFVNRAMFVTMIEMQKKHGSDKRLAVYRAMKDKLQDSIALRLDLEEGKDFDKMEWFTGKASMRNSYTKPGVTVPVDKITLLPRTAYTLVGKAYDYCKDKNLLKNISLGTVKDPETGHVYKEEFLIDDFMTKVRGRSYDD